MANEGPAAQERGSALDEELRKLGNTIGHIVEEMRQMRRAVDALSGRLSVLEKSRQAEHGKEF